MRFRRKLRHRIIELDEDVTSPKTALDGEPIGLVLRTECEKMLAEARAERKLVPFTYESEAQYRQGDAVIECPTYERKEGLFKHEAV